MAEGKFDLDIAVQGLQELDKLRKSLEEIQGTSEKISKQKSFGDYLASGFKKASSAAWDLSKTVAKIGTAAAGAAIIGSLNAGAQYKSAQKAAQQFAGSISAGNAAMAQMDAITKRTGLEINDARRKMNAFLASGVDPKVAANFGLITTYMEKMSDEGSSAAGQLQDLAAGVDLTVTNFEDFTKGFGLSQDQFLKILGYQGKQIKNSEELTKFVQKYNKELGGGKAAFAALAKSGALDKFLEDAKTSGSLLDRMKNSLNRLFESAGKNIDLEKTLAPLFKLMEDPATIAALTKGIEAFVKALAWVGENAETLAWIAGITAALTALLGFIGKVVAAWPVIVAIAKGIAVAAVFIAKGIAAIVGAISLPVLAVVAAITLVLVAIWYFWDEIVSGFEKGTAFLSNKWSELTAWFSNFASSAAQWGSDLVQGLINGVIAKSTELINSIKTLASDALQAFKDVFDINSPSKEMMMIGKYNVMGLQQGQEKESTKLLNSSAGIAQGVLGGVSSAAGASETTNKNNNITINISAGGNADEIASSVRRVFQELNFQLG